MAGVTYETLEGREAEAQLDTLLPTYKEVFAEPPYRDGPKEVAEFIELFHIQAKRPGCRVVLAREGADVVGFSFGYQLPTDSQWWTALLEPMPEDFTRETNERTFAIIDLAVRKPWRRQGIAAGLHSRLLDGLSAERVTLTVRPEPEAAAAQSAYAAWGYRTVGRSRPWDEAPLYDAMVLNLR